MSLNWKRRAYAVIDGVRVDGLRLRFRAKKSIQPDPNTLELTIFNLSAATRGALTKDSVRVFLWAGYEGTEQIIFAGTTRTVDHAREGTEWVTNVECGDGEMAYDRVSSFSFAPGAALADVFARIAEDLGVDAKDAVTRVRGMRLPGMDRFLQGYTASGRSVRELDRVAKAAGLEWSIQDGRLELRQPAQANEDSVVLLSADTGLVGSPEHKVEKEKGSRKGPVIIARALLNGDLRPYRRVKVVSATRNGLYRIETVEHAGDTDGNEWFTIIQGRG